MTDTKFPARPLNRREASAYLWDNYGISRTPATLAKLAVVGGGPAFVKANRTPLYSPAALDAFAREITSPEVRSTSEHRRLAENAAA